MKTRTLQEISQEFQLKYDTIIQLLDNHGIKIERRPDQIITDQQLTLIEKEVKEISTKNQAGTKKRISTKHYTQISPVVRQSLKDWFNSRSKVTVVELAKKIHTDVGMLLFELNKGQSFKYTEYSIVDGDRFSASINFLAAKFQSKSKRKASKSPKKKRVNKKKKLAEEQTVEEENIEEKVGFLTERDFEPEIRWRVQLIGHPKQ